LKTTEILILGAHGQLGSTLIRTFGVGSAAIGLGRSQADLQKLPELVSTLNALKPKVIINAAAYTAVDKAEDEIELSRQINGTAMAELAKWCRENDTLLIHFSTDYVYGSSDKTYPALKESDPTLPLGQYGKSKLEGELNIQKSGCRYLIFRLSWVYSFEGNNFFLTMLRLGQERESLSVVADQMGYPTYTGTIAEALKQILPMAQKPGFSQWGIYNFAGPDFVSWHQFATEIIEQAAARGWRKKTQEVKKLTTDQWPSRAKRQLNSRFDCGLFKKTFGFQPSEHALGLRQCMDEFQKKFPEKFRN